MGSAAERNTAINIWTARILPIILSGVIGYATYVTIYLLCVNYLFRRHHDNGFAIPVLVVYFVLFVPMMTSYARLYYTTVVDPPYISLGPAAIRERAYMKEKAKIRSEEDGVGAGEYDLTEGKDDPDSPGLELFYTKDVFVSDIDGKPKWCSHCANWKPDRAHHDSSSGRCIAKMDHFCPWVGGPVGETNFKFFIQFNFWTASYCLTLLIVMGVAIRRQTGLEGESINPHFIAILALASAFFTFTSSMTGNAVVMALKNLTTIEHLVAKSAVHVLAIRKTSYYENRNKRLSSTHGPLQEITYPLAHHTPNRPIFHNARATINIEPDTERHVGSLSNPPSDAATGYNQNSGAVHNGIRTPSPVQHNLVQQRPTTQYSTDRTDNSSSRDLQASRIFVLVKTNPGDNPWALSSPLLNFKTVMGFNIVQWFLPTASPCSVHENSESQFTLGPAVDSLRHEYGFQDEVSY
ncbi:DHHC palmitoyltransferase-domain-containing protein [Amylocarpus encephaloides]|uniref:Palmitoyltransferase n=1 Tax=Amylocarpus encephaloides TaxID=45428 RepID=A0A9P7YIB3_9HELO|nr:DHHC palmitoyltransferase-domain-containing protein [Amylocarpus encephaloides]